VARLSHYDKRGKARMVNVTAKSLTQSFRDGARIRQNDTARLRPFAKLENPKATRWSRAHSRFPPPSVPQSGYLFVTNALTQHLMCTPACAKMAWRFALK